MSNSIKKIVTGFSTVALAVSMLVVPVAKVDAATAGEVYKTTDGTVWFITKDMKRRPFTSAGAFMSYGFLSFSQVKDADSAVTALSTGDFIAPQDGRIFCATETKGSDVAGECSLITGSKKAAFTSASVFTGQGFSFSRAYYGDSSFLSKTSNVDNAAAQHLAGTLVNNGGTVQLVVSGGLWGVPSMDVFNSWGWSFADVVPANTADKLLSQTGVIPARMAGELVPTATTSNNDDSDADCNDLQGNAGDITVTQTGEFAAEEVGEGEEDQGVLSFEVEADDDSDVDVTSVKLEIKQTDATVSQKIGDYIDEVKVWHGDTEIGSADADDFTKSGTVYTKSVSLDCAAVASGETGDFWVSVTAVDNLDSADIATDDFEVELMQVRFEDGDGVTTTESIAANAIDETFNFVNFATANDVEFTVALNDDADDVNESHNIIVDEDDATTDEPLLSFTIEATGDSDIWVDEIPVTFTTSDSQLATVISKVDLYKGSTMVDSKSVTGTLGTDEVFTFDDLDTTIDAGDTEEFTVKARILALTGNYSEGATLKAEVTGTNTDAIVAEDEEGDQVSDANAKGTALGEAHSLFSDGITVEVNSADTTIISNDGANNDGLQLSWNVTITNIGDDAVFINRDSANVVDTYASAEEVEMDYNIEGGGTETSVSGTVVSDATEVSGGVDYTGDGFYKLSAGQSKDFTITVTAINSAASAQVRGVLAGIEWTVDDVTTFTGTETINNYTANLAEDSRTPYKLIN